MDLYIRASEIKNNHNLILYRNRNESTFNVCRSLLVIMMMGFTSCGDDELQFSEEQVAISTKTRNTSGKRKQRKDGEG